MFRNDDPTAASSLPAVGPAGTPGFWASGNPAIGQPATKLIRDWFNIVTEELIALTTMAGVVPNKANMTQLVQSLLALSVIQDAGAVNALVTNTRVPIAGLTSGTRICVIPAFTCTGPSTHNFSGNGPVAIVRPDGTPTQDGDIVQGQPLDLMLWAGSWIMLNPWRPPLVTQPISYWINSASGNDNNPGTQALPWASLQHADTVLRKINLNGQVITINCSGTFAAPSGTSVLLADGPYPGAKGAGSVVFLFSAGSTVTATLANCIQAQNGADLTVSGPVTLTATGPTAGIGQGLYALNGSTIQFEGAPIFGACGGDHIAADTNANVLNIGTGYSIIGGASDHLLVARSGNVRLNANGVSLTVSLTGTPNFTGQFAACSDGNIEIDSSLVSFSGAATGKRYSVFANGVIDTNNGSATFLPGSVSGTVATGGQYI